MQLDRTSVYRVHESPKEKRLADYREDVLARVPCGNLAHRPEVQKLLARLADLPIGAALKIGFLRSLMRARYAVEPLRHFTVWPKRNTRISPRPFVDTRISWCIALSLTCAVVPAMQRSSVRERRHHQPESRGLPENLDSLSVHLPLSSALYGYCCLPSGRASHSLGNVCQVLRAIL